MSTEYDGRCVLIADDESSVREVMSRSIKVGLGSRVHESADGDEVLRHLEVEHCDVLVTDMMMPGPHGLELLKEVRSRWPSLDVVVVTGAPDQFPYVDVINSGACDFIVKPFLPEELQAKLVRIFKERDVRIAQEQAEHRYRNLFDLSMNGMLLLDPERHTILDVNEAFCALSSYARDALLGRSFLDLLSGDETERFVRSLALFSKGGKGTLSDLVLSNPDGENSFLDVSVTFISRDSDPMLLISIKDVTEQRRLQDKLGELAHKDSTTGLLNRHSFLVRMEGAISQAKRTETPLTLMFLDLDNFKAVNDGYGHQTGDAVLHTVGQVITKQIRDKDLGFRYGGDEFAVLLVGADKNIGSRVAERLRSEFNACERYGTTLSVGLVEYSDEMSTTTFVSAADEALYAAKSAGKNLTYVA